MLFKKIEGTSPSPWDNWVEGERATEPSIPFTAPTGMIGDESVATTNVRRGRDGERNEQICCPGTV